MDLADEDEGSEESEDDLYEDVPLPEGGQSVDIMRYDYLKSKEAKKAKSKAKSSKSKTKTKPAPKNRSTLDRLGVTAEQAQALRAKFEKEFIETHTVSHSGVRWPDDDSCEIERALARGEMKSPAMRMVRNFLRICPSVVRMHAFSGWVTVTLLHLNAKTEQVVSSASCAYKKPAVWTTKDKFVHGLEWYVNRMAMERMTWVLRYHYLLWIQMVQLRRASMRVVEARMQHVDELFDGPIDEHDVSFGAGGRKKKHIKAGQPVGGSKKRANSPSHAGSGDEGVIFNVRGPDYVIGEEIPPSPWGLSGVVPKGLQAAEDLNQRSKLCLTDGYLLGVVAEGGVLEAVDPPRPVSPQQQGLDIFLSAVEGLPSPPGSQWDPRSEIGSPHSVRSAGYPLQQQTWQQSSLQKQTVTPQLQQQQQPIPQQQQTWQPSMQQQPRQQTQQQNLQQQQTIQPPVQQQPQLPKQQPQQQSTLQPSQIEQAASPSGAAQSASPQTPNQSLEMGTVRQPRPVGGALSSSGRMPISSGRNVRKTEVENLVAELKNVLGGAPLPQHLKAKSSNAGVSSSSLAKPIPPSTSNAVPRDAPSANVTAVPAAPEGAEASSTAVAATAPQLDQSLPSTESIQTSNAQPETNQPATSDQVF
eukprot:gnl/MRDRNA2_/MRDRNA2_77328_c0_seq1.p1 gnl/MRDRNA2_/MRDRNA2_77328_c0~~gnl/MRDRNA2_/MRDRNA2_77328_c0_seq1.p1  ORF type:complete len:640 (+),score=148.96 gnl/MRDRNA2_/MRDRNA2_77328_c0_seq1:125-2044(+)